MAPAATPPIPPTPPTPPVDPNVVQLGQLMAVLGQDPKYRDRILGLIEEGSPQTHIPERAVARQAEQKIEEGLKPLREENKTLTERLGKLESSLAQRTWQEQFGVDDEEFAAVTTLAKEKKIGDPNTALEYYRQADLGRPRGTHSSAHLNDESRKELYRNPKQWYEKEANKILSESRRRRSA
jgi:hypothetical protein